MNVTIVHFGALQKGGYPPDTRALAAALHESGHPVTLAAEPGPRTDGLGDTIVVDPTAPMTGAAPDVIHLMGLMRPRQLGYMKRLGSRSPLVISPLTQLSVAHMGRSKFKKLPYFTYVRWRLAKRRLSLHGFSDLELVESERVLKAMSTFVAPSGVFDASKPRWNGEGGYMLFFGRNDVHQKGIDLLLEAYGAYREAGGRTPLVVAGQPWGSSAQVIARLAPEGVDVRGPVEEDEKWKLLSDARALFFLSRFDGPPRPIREAISIGAPVIVTPGTHMSDMVGEYEAGVPAAFDVRSVSDAMLAADDPTRRESWAQGSERLSARLSWARVAEDYVNGYESAIEAQS